MYIAWFHCTGLIFLLGTLPMHAQHSTWQQLYDSAYQAMMDENYEKALPFLQQALPLSFQHYQTDKKDSTYGITANQLAIALFFQTQYDSAEYYNEQARQTFEKNFGKNSLYYADALHNRGVLAYGRDNYPMAEEYYKQALAIYTEACQEYSNNYHLYLRRLGDLYTEWNAPEKALEIYQECLALALRHSGKKSVNYIMSLSGLADIYTKLADYNQAELYHEEAHRLAKEVFGENHPWTIYLRRFVAILYSELGRYEEAMEIAQQDLKYHEENITEVNRRNITPLLNVGVLHFYLKNYDEALEYFDKAAVLTKELLGEDSYLYAMLMSYLGKVYHQQHDFQKAIACKEKNIHLMQKIGVRGTEYFLDLQSLATSYAAVHDYHKAEELYQEALIGIEAEVGSLHTYYMEILPEYARLCYLQGNMGQAEALFKAASDKILWQLSKNFIFMSEIEKVKYRKKIANHFEVFNTFALYRRAENPAIVGDLYNIQLATKSMLMQSAKKLKQNIINSEDSTQTKLFNQWQQGRGELAKFYNASAEENFITIDSLEEVVNTLEKELSRQSFKFAQALDTTRYTWQKVQQQLQANEAAVEMVRFRKYDFDSAGFFTDTIYYAALLVKPDSQYPEMVLLEHGNALENEYLTAYRTDVQRKEREYDTYNRFWQPLKNALSDTKIVYFSSDGVYHQINLNTLYNPETGKYVLDEVNIRPLTSTRELLIEHKMDNPNKNIVLFGFPDYQLSPEKRKSRVDSLLQSSPEFYALNLERGGDFSPLPGTKKEAENIGRMAKQYGWHTAIYIEDQALEEKLKILRNPAVLHIATHGYFQTDHLPDDPALENPLLRSGLLMAGSKVSLSESTGIDSVSENLPEDGILTAYEAMNLNLDNTEFVVLSACETGLGEVRNGEGVYGLQRAFTVAGAQSVLMSLWKVNDVVTQEMMSIFYQRWLGGMEKHKAFREAQLHIKRKFSHPYYWGAFVMLGK